MIPLRDENPTRTLPAVTLTLLAVNVVTHLYQMTLDPKLSWVFLHQFGAIPYELVHSRSIGAVTLESPVPRYLTLLTSMFVHGDVFHLGGNMLYLWIFGNNVEDVFGKGRFILFYVLCGLAASASHVLINMDSRVPIVGASGAIAGVLGAYFVLFPNAKVTTLVVVFFFIRLIQIPASLVLGIWLVLQMLSAASNQPGVAWFAHIGGFLAGVFLVMVFLPRRKPFGR